MWQIANLAYFRCLRLPVVAIAILLLSATAPAQDSASSRVSDERVATADERQRLVVILLSGADEARHGREPGKAAELLVRAGRFQIRLQKSRSALATFKQAYELSKGRPSDSAATVDSLNGMATIFAQTNKCAEAQSSLGKAISISERTGYVAGNAEALLIRSDCENHGDHSQALKTAQDSLLLWQSLNHRWGIAKTYATIGHYQFAKNELDESTRSHNAALFLWQELNIPAEQGEALINLAFIEYRRGAWQSSLALLTQASHLIDENAEPFRMGQITGGMAEAFIESGLPEIGLAKSILAAEYFRRAESPRAELVMLWDIGKAHLLLGNYSDAITNLRQGVAGGILLNEPVLVGLCSEYLGRTYSEMKQFSTALTHYQTALVNFRKASNPMEEARTQALIGRLYQSQGKVAAAREHYRGALQTFIKVSDQLNKSATLYALGTLELQQNNLDAAEKLLLESIDATENIRRVSTSNDLASAFSANVHERYESLLTCLMRKHALFPSAGFAQRAFETSELSRSRSLSDLLHATQTNLAPGVNPELAAEEKSLRQSLRVKEDQKVTLLAKEYTSAELSALDFEIRRLEIRYKQVTDSIGGQQLSYQHLEHPTAWSLGQIQREIVSDDETVLLEYSLGPEKGYVWAVTRNTFASYEIPSHARITTSVKKVYELLSVTPSPEIDRELSEALQELSQMVLSPVEAELNKRRIIVVADGALHYVPFQVLRMPSGSGEHLIVSHELINTPSASILGQLRQEKSQRQPPARILAAFGDPKFESNFDEATEAIGSEQLAGLRNLNKSKRASRNIEPEADVVDVLTIQPLIYSKLELANLRQVAGIESLIATGFDATPEKLAQANLADYRILHIATHGKFDPKRPENSGLFLSTVDRNKQPRDGFLGLEDIYSLRAPVELVVLSACRTGLGKEVSGEGLIGLTRGFMYAGASSVVASLWKVDDEATSELMKHFYLNMLQRGMPPSAALRAAQNTIREQPLWQSPYFWAAFTLQGEYRHTINPPHSEPRTKYVVLSGGALVGLIAITLWWYFRRRNRLGRHHYSTVK